MLDLVYHRREGQNCNTSVYAGTWCVCVRVWVCVGGCACSIWCTTGVRVRAVILLCTQVCGMCVCVCVCVCEGDLGWVWLGVRAGLGVSPT